MRLDKFLKLSRLIKRRTVANKICSSEKILINEKIAKASTKVKVNDVLEIKINENNKIKVRVLKINEFANKQNCQEMYEII